MLFARVFSLLTTSSERKDSEELIDWLDRQELKIEVGGRPHRMKVTIWSKSGKLISVDHDIRSAIRAAKKEIGG